MPHRLVHQSAFEQATAATSVASASAAWMAPLQDWLQLIATVVAIVAGCLAIYSHFRRNSIGGRDHADKRSKPD